ncbi:MAG TPA: IPT/TIG domain-containing protein, partial [Gaiellaceae bacterium]|nr:IPT/TIG domain-containing protein [Gaiellaceae bacterium]
SDEGGRGDFGWSVALAWDGSTALIGGPSDTAGTDGAGNATNAGAAWVFARAGSAWKQQGGKLTGPGGVASGFGRTVALSADGGTALIGGDQDGGAPAFPGAVWTFARSGSAWKAVGPKLVLDDPDGATSGFGSTLSLAAGGSTALIGGATAGYREVWQYARTSSGWKQEAQLPTLGSIDFGQTMALTPGGDTALIGTSEGTGPGSAYIFHSTLASGAPTISHVAVAAGHVTILGKNLTGAAIVKVGSAGATITSVSATKVTATVSASATGQVTVITAHGTATGP